jgi:hypothetical protein
MPATPYSSVDKLRDFNIFWSRPVIDAMIECKDFPATCAPNTWTRASIERFCRKRDHDLAQPLGWLKRGEQW